VLVTAWHKSCADQYTIGLCPRELPMMRVIRGKPLRVDCATAFYSGSVGADALIWLAVLAECCALPTTFEVNFSLIAIVAFLMLLWPKERA
jgi:hypothetical protein